ncbi:MAG: nitroreductase family protein [Deltaproteobacteria bacterium]|nr:nitroreductase family protein [Deltaproteobacteria bacterium]
MRRSFRKYAKREIEFEKIIEIENTIKDFQLTMGFKHSMVKVTKNKEEFESVIRAAKRGLVGKINPWLNKTNATNLLIAIVNTNDTDQNLSERFKRIAETSILMEVAILRATELGLASCWLAGVNTSEIEKEYKLGDGEEVIAIATLGYPPISSNITDYDFWANKLVSARRKHLSEIMFYDEIKE